jgi:hypothetical protein
MQILRAPIFLLFCFLFIVHQVLQKLLHVPIRFADDYLDNLLITPILLTFLVVERRILFRKGNGYYLSPLEVILATVLIAVVCELLFPYLSSDFVTDWLDLLFYAAGSLIFYFAINFWPGRAAGDRSQ